MRLNRGFVSIFILGVGLLLLTLGLMFSYFLGRNSRLESLYVTDARLRNVVYPAMKQLVEANPAAAFSESQISDFDSAGRKVTLTRSAVFSAGGSFRTLSVTGEVAGRSFGLRNYSFLPGTGIYSVPLFNKDYCYNLSLAEIKQNGFGQYIYYHKGDLSVPTGTYNCNSMVIVEGNLTIAAGTVFQGRIIFLVDRSSSGGGRATLGTNVSMEDGVIFSQASLNVGIGSRLKGYFNSGMTINAPDENSLVINQDALGEFHSVSYVY